MKTKEELFKELKELGITINNYSEKEYLGTNSLGQKFYEGDKGWYYYKGNNFKYNINIYVILTDFKGDSLHSEAFSTRQDAYRAMIKFAQDQGEVIEVLKDGNWYNPDNRKMNFDCWEDDLEHPENVYRIRPEKKYRAYTMEDNREHLRGVWVKSKTTDFEMQVVMLSARRLNSLFKDYTFLDGSIIGVEI